MKLEKDKFIVDLSPLASLAGIHQMQLLAAFFQYRIGSPGFSNPFPICKKLIALQEILNITTCIYHYMESVFLLLPLILMERSASCYHSVKPGNIFTGLLYNGNIILPDWHRPIACTFCIILFFLESKIAKQKPCAKWGLILTTAG